MKTAATVPTDIAVQDREIRSCRSNANEPWFSVHTLALLYRMHKGQGGYMLIGWKWGGEPCVCASKSRLVSLRKARPLPWFRNVQLDRERISGLESYQSWHMKPFYRPRGDIGPSISAVLESDAGQTHGSDAAGGWWMDRRQWERKLGTFQSTLGFHINHNISSLSGIHLEPAQGFPLVCGGSQVQPV